MDQTSTGVMGSPAGVGLDGHNYPVIGDASSMVVTRRSSRLRAFRAAAPFFARGGGVWLHGFVHSCSNALLGVAALTAIVVVAAVVLGSARPSWWREGGGSTSDARRTLAGAVDNGAWTVVTQVRPMKASDAWAGGGAGAGGRVLSEPWSVSLSAEAATAWLNEKLPQWLTAQRNTVRLPVGAEMLAVFEAGVVRLGIRLHDESGGGERYVALSITPRLDEGGLWLPASSASLGRLELPVGAVIAGKNAGAGGGESVSRELAAVLRGEAPALAGAVIKLPDGRRVRLLRFEVVEERLVLTMRTEAGGNGQMANDQRAK